jgi:predicted glycogen debranching enzyme
MKRIGFGREVTSHLEIALTREWLVTNGMGGYALGTVAGANTRRYHGLLVAALRPPVGCTVLVSKLEATVRLGPDIFPLTTNEYLDGTINPHGYHRLESFRLEGMIPIFTWAVIDALIEQRIWMVHGQNTTYVTYTLARASRPIALEIIPLCTHRDSHGVTDARGGMPEVQAAPNGLRVDFGHGSVPYWLRASRGTLVPGVDRYWSFRHRAENYHGLDDREDLFAVGRIDTRLSEGETLALVLTTEQGVQVDWPAAYETEKARQAALLAQAKLLEDEPAWVRHLALAADQFIVSRPTDADPQGQTIIAGYPWFRDWGRDAMVALPGLALITGRPEIAAGILRAFASSIDQGMLPNRCPGDQAEYKTADATLWLFYALHYYLKMTGDLSLIQDLYPTLSDVVEWHLKGTRYGLGVDEKDGLLQTGAADVGLTWMNAQDGDHVVTPRVGKPVEINALWHNALGTMAHFATQLEHAGAARWRELADRVAESFEARFWYEAGGYLYDVVDGPEGDDAALRPNQVLAVALPHSPLKDQKKARAVVDTVARHLQTSYGLRTLSPHDPAYVHRYGGRPAARENAYHQGTVWAWLMGPFVMAHLKVYGDVDKACSFLRPFADHLFNCGLGTISEIFDGDSPHTPRGCVASAWSVGQVLCAWLACGEVT